MNDFMHESHERVEKQKQKQRDHNTKKDPAAVQYTYITIIIHIMSYGSTLRKGVKSGPTPAVPRPTRCA